MENEEQTAKRESIEKILVKLQETKDNRDGLIVLMINKDGTQEIMSSQFVGVTLNVGHQFLLSAFLKNWLNGFFNRETLIVQPGGKL